MREAYSAGMLVSNSLFVQPRYFGDCVLACGVMMHSAGAMDCDSRAHTRADRSCSCAVALPCTLSQRQRGHVLLALLMALGPAAAASPPAVGHVQLAPAAVLALEQVLDLGWHPIMWHIQFKSIQTV